MRWRRIAFLVVLGILAAPAGALVSVAIAPAVRAVATQLGEAPRPAATSRPRALPVATSTARARVRAMRLAGGGGEPAREPAKKVLRDRLELLALIALWYAASVVCTNTTKSIGAHWSVLTFSQLVLSTVCGAVVVCVLGYPQKFQAQILISPFYSDFIW
jgi:hypothetical protein